MNRYLGRVISPAQPRQATVVSTVWRPERYIVIETAEGDKAPLRLLGRVESVEAVNPYFATPDRIDFVDDKDVSDTRHAKYVYSISLLGALVDGRYDEALSPPPPPGSIAQLATAVDLEALATQPGADFSIGSMIGIDDCPIKLSSRDLWTSHTCVIGRTGAGKSHLVRVLIGSLKGKGAIVLFTPSSEYRADARGLRGPCRYFDSDTITVRFALSEIVSALALSPPEVELVRTVLFGERVDLRQQNLWSRSGGDLSNLARLRENRGSVSGEDLAQALDAVQTEPARSAAHKLRYCGLRFGGDHHAFELGSDGLHVYDLSGFNERASQYVVFRVLSNLFQARKSRSGLQVPTLIVIEEAHSFIPSTHGAISKDVCARIAREGRKLGLSLVIVSQRPRQIDPTVTSQARNLFVFELPNPDDLSHALAHTGAGDLNLAAAVRSLRDGECVMVIGNHRALSVRVASFVSKPAEVGDRES